MFTPVSSRAASTYRQASANGASPHQLVSMLFDVLLQAINSARDGLRQGDVEAKCRHIGRAVRFLDEGLKAGLDDKQGGEIASNLRSLYEYCIDRLTVANLRSDDAILAEVYSLIEPVAQGWRQIGSMGGQAAAQPAAPAAAKFSPVYAV